MCVQMIVLATTTTTYTCSNIQLLLLFIYILVFSDVDTFTICNFTGYVRADDPGLRLSTRLHSIWGKYMTDAFMMIQKHSISLSMPCASTSLV